MDKCTNPAERAHRFGLPILTLTKDKLYVVTSATGSGGCNDANDVLLTYSCSANTLGATLTTHQADTQAAAGVICATYPGSGAPPFLTLVCVSVP
jgi:hypothetical protein